MDVQPYRIHIEDAVLDDLKDRLARTRWPDEIPGSDWDYGSNLAYIKELVEYWRTEFDWRAQEEKLNRFPHFMTNIEGIDIHFIHQKGTGPNPMPLGGHPRLAQHLFRDYENNTPPCRSRFPRRLSRGLLRRGGPIHAGLRIFGTDQ